MTSVVQIKIEALDESKAAFSSTAKRIRAFKRSAEASLGGVGAASKKTAAEVRKIGDEFKKIKGATTGLKKAGTGLKTMGAGAKSASVGLSGMTSGMSQFLGVSIGLAGVNVLMRRLISGGKEYSIVLAEIATLTDEAAFSTEKQRDITEGLARQFGVLQNEVGKGLYQTISAGATDAALATDILTEAIGLSIGGLTSVKEAVDILTSAVNSFGVENLTAARASDVLFETVRRGKTTLGELAAVEGRILPLAKELGVTFEELNAAIVAQTKQGASTAEATTRLRSIFTAMIKKAEDFSTAFSEIGLVYDENTIKNRGFIRTLEDTRRALAGQRDRFTKLFGRIEATTGALALTTDQSKLYKEALDGMANSTGAAGLAMDEIRSSSGRRFNEFLNEISNTVDQIGEKLVEAFDFVFLRDTKLSEFSEEMIRAAIATERTRKEIEGLRDEMRRVSTDSGDVVVNISDKELERVEATTSRLRELGFAAEDAAAGFNLLTGEATLSFSVADKGPKIIGEARQVLGNIPGGIPSVVGDASEKIVAEISSGLEQNQGRGLAESIFSFDAVNTQEVTDQIVTLIKASIKEAAGKVAKLPDGQKIEVPFVFEELSFASNLEKINAIGIDGINVLYGKLTNQVDSEGNALMDQIILTLEDGSREVVTQINKISNRDLGLVEFSFDTEPIKKNVDDTVKEFRRLDEVRKIVIGGGVSVLDTSQLNETAASLAGVTAAGEEFKSARVDVAVVEKQINDELERSGINLKELGELSKDEQLRREAVGELVSRTAADQTAAGLKLIEAEEERLKLAASTNKELTNDRVRAQGAAGIAAARATLKLQEEFLKGKRDEEATEANILSVARALLRTRADINKRAAENQGTEAIVKVLSGTKPVIAAASEIVRLFKLAVDHVDDLAASQARLVDEQKLSVILAAAHGQTLSGIDAALTRQDRRFSELVAKTAKLETISISRKFTLLAIIEGLRQATRLRIIEADAAKRGEEADKNAAEHMRLKVDAQLQLNQNTETLAAILRDGVTGTLRQELVSIKQSSELRKNELQAQFDARLITLAQLNEELRLTELVAEVDSRRAALRAGAGSFGESFAVGIQQATQGLRTMSELGREAGSQLGNAAGQFAGQMAASEVSWDRFKDTVIRGILELIAQFAILRAVSSFLPGFGVGAESFAGANLAPTPGSGGFVLPAGGFAQGGIMSGTMLGSTSLPVNAYAHGGIASTPQLAMFGEGRGNEAFVPLGNSRSIRVDDGGTFNALSNQMRSISSMIATRGGASGGGGNTFQLSVDARGAQDAAGVELAVSRALTKSMPTIERAIGDSMMNGTSGRLTRGVRFATRGRG